MMTQRTLLEKTTSISQHLVNNYIKKDQYTLINNKCNTLDVIEQTLVTNKNYRQAKLATSSLVKSTRYPAPELAKKERALLFKISSSPLNFTSIAKKLTNMAGISLESRESSLDRPFSKFTNKFSVELGPYYNLYCFYEESEHTVELTSRPPGKQARLVNLPSDQVAFLGKKKTDLQSNFFVLFLSFSLDTLPDSSTRVQSLLESNLKLLVPNLTVEDCKKRKLTVDEGHIKTRSLRSFRGALIRLFFKNPLLNFGKTKIIAVRGTKAQFSKVYIAAARNTKLELSYESKLEMNTLQQFLN